LPKDKIIAASEKAKPLNMARPEVLTALRQTDGVEAIIIKAPDFQRGIINIVGTAPYVQHKFSEKARAMIEAAHRAGSQAKKGKAREPRDFEGDYEKAMHVSEEGWIGIPAPAFRNAAISACRIAGFAMTKAKLSVFVEADGMDRDDGSPLVRIYGEPTPYKSVVRNESGVVDLRWRPMFREWRASVTVRWDEGQFSVNDVMNLFARAGVQVGIGEGRPDSPNSNGLGFGLWEIV
jgi:hypothetical protein